MIEEKILLNQGDYSLGDQLLYGNRCKKCQGRFFPRRDFCPSCLENDTMEDFVIPKEGQLYTFTVIHTGPKMFNPPYIIGYVDVDPNLRLFGHINGKINQLRINQSMDIKIGQIGSNGEESLFGIVFIPKEEN